MKLKVFFSRKEYVAYGVLPVASFSHAAFFTVFFPFKWPLTHSHIDYYVIINMYVTSVSRKYNYLLWFLCCMKTDFWDSEAPTLNWCMSIESVIIVSTRRQAAIVAWHWLWLIFRSIHLPMWNTNRTCAWIHRYANSSICTGERARSELSLKWNKNVQMLLSAHIRNINTFNWFNWTDTAVVI